MDQQVVLLILDYLNQELEEVEEQLLMEDLEGDLVDQVEMD
jgi:hypothetical protein